MMAGKKRNFLLLTFARQGELESVAQAIFAIKSDLPHTHFFAVGTPVSHAALQSLGIDDIILYGDGRGVKQVSQEARSRAPDAIVVIYSDPGAKGHLKLELLALMIGAPSIYRFLPDAEQERTSRLSLLWSAKWKILLAASCLALGVVLCGFAYCFLRAKQRLAGGGHASRP